MERDARRSQGQWRGCHAFQNIICDGCSAHTVARNGGLKMGYDYWFYYELDGGTEVHDITLPSTTSCPFLPGQPVNILEVPIQMVEPRTRSASLDSMSAAYPQTMRPQDKFLIPRAISEDPQPTRLNTSPPIIMESSQPLRPTRSVSPKKSPWSPSIFFGFHSSQRTVSPAVCEEDLVRMNSPAWIPQLPSTTKHSRSMSDRVTPVSVSRPFPRDPDSYNKATIPPSRSFLDPILTDKASSLPSTANAQDALHATLLFRAAALESQPAEQFQPPYLAADVIGRERISKSQVSCGSRHGQYDILVEKYLSDTDDYDEDDTNFANCRTPFLNPAVSPFQLTGLTPPPTRSLSTKTSTESLHRANQHIMCYYSSPTMKPLPAIPQSPLLAINPYRSPVQSEKRNGMMPLDTSLVDFTSLLSSPSSTSIHSDYDNEFSKSQFSTTSTDFSTCLEAQAQDEDIFRNKQEFHQIIELVRENSSSAVTLLQSSDPARMAQIEIKRSGSTSSSFSNLSTELPRATFGGRKSTLPHEQLDRGDYETQLPWSEKDWMHDLSYLGDVIDEHLHEISMGQSEGLLCTN